VKQEDADWRVYHLIPPDASINADVLAEKSGLDPSIIEESLARLQRYCLIQRNGQEVRVLSFGEALIHNQCKYEPDLPFVIENGVVKERKR